MSNNIPGMMYNPNAAKEREKRKKINENSVLANVREVYNCKIKPHYPEALRKAADELERVLGLLNDQITKTTLEDVLTLLSREYECEVFYNVDKKKFYYEDDTFVHDIVLLTHSKSIRFEDTLPLYIVKQICEFFEGEQ